MPVPEMATRDGYGAVRDSLAARITIMTALAPLVAALRWQASCG